MCVHRMYTLRKKYISFHWDGTFFGTDLYLWGSSMHIWGTKVYFFKRYRPSDNFSTFYSESEVKVTATSLSKNLHLHSWNSYSLSLFRGLSDNETLQVLRSSPRATIEVLPSHWLLHRALPESAHLRLPEDTLKNTLRTTLKDYLMRH